MFSQFESVIVEVLKELIGRIGHRNVCRVIAKVLSCNQCNDGNDGEWGSKTNPQKKVIVSTRNRWLIARSFVFLLLISTASNSGRDWHNSRANKRREKIHSFEVWVSQIKWTQQPRKKARKKNAWRKRISWSGDNGFMHIAGAVTASQRCAVIVSIVDIDQIHRQNKAKKERAKNQSPKRDGFAEATRSFRLAANHFPSINLCRRDCTRRIWASAFRRDMENTFKPIFFRLTWQFQLFFNAAQQRHKESS